jgi:ferredoxin
MIIAKRKPLDKIAAMLEGRKKVLVLGCSGCVTVCMEGGEAETNAVAAALRLKFPGAQFDVETILRLCEFDLADQIAKKAKDGGYDTVLTLACGVGLNFLAERLGAIPVFPGADTSFMGGAVERGVWTETCVGCGDCIAHLFGGICPIARCSKSIMNGPCGGTREGKCEVSKEKDCAWVLIYKRMKELGKLETLSETIPPRRWNSSHHGGPRKQVHGGTANEVGK